MNLEQYELLMRATGLFEGIKTEDLLSIMSCLDARTKDYYKGETIISLHEPAKRVGIMLEGRASIAKEDAFGNQTLMSEAIPGQIFGEVFACARVEQIPVRVEAVTDCRILFLDCHRIITSCTSACEFHHRLIENMLSIMAHKAMALNQKIEHISKRTTREKLLSYLADCAREAGEEEFELPFNRQQLADYLCVDRSAMCTELGRLRDDGIIELNKKKIRLKTGEQRRR